MWALKASKCFFFLSQYPSLFLLPSFLHLFMSHLTTFQLSTSFSPVSACPNSLFMFCNLMAVNSQPPAFFSTALAPRLHYEIILHHFYLSFLPTSRCFNMSLSSTECLLAKHFLQTFKMYGSSSSSSEIVYTRTNTRTYTHAHRTITPEGTGDNGLILDTCS